MAVARKYIRQCRSLFPVYGKLERTFLKRLKVQVDEHLELFPSSSYEELLEQFGTPREVVLEYYNTIDDEFALLPMSEIDEKNMLTPEEFQKVVDAAIQLETQAPMEDNDPDKYSDESVDQISGRASGETVTESQTRKVAVSKNQYIRLKCTATFVTRYNSSKKRRFITEIKSAKVTVTGLGFTWKKSPTMTKKIIDGGRTGEISCLGVLKNSSGFTKQVSETFEFYCNSAGGIEIR